MNEILRNLNANLDLKSENYGSKYREIEQKNSIGILGHFNNN